MELTPSRGMPGLPSPVFETFAPVYDLLTQQPWWDRQIEALIAHLGELPEGAHIGGTGAARVRARSVIGIGEHEDRMPNYDADIAPLAAAWLSLDEDERLSQALAHHLDLVDSLHPPGDNPSVHATLHQVIETQVAAGEPMATAATLARLVATGMRRHAAVHMLCEALAADLVSMMVEGRSFDPALWGARLEALEPSEWIARQMHRDLTD